MNMSVQPGLGVRRRVGPDVAGVTVWQIECKEIGFPLDATDHDQGFAEIGLRMAPGDVKAARTSRASLAFCCERSL